jgi:hypothetical protein
MTGPVIRSDALGRAGRTPLPLVSAAHTPVSGLPFKCVIFRHPALESFAWNIIPFFLR